MAKALNVNVSVTADASQAKAELQSLQSTLQALSTSSTNLKIGINTAEIQKATAATAELMAHLKQATNAQGVLNFSALNNSLASSHKTLQQYGDQLLRLGPKGQQAFGQLTKAIATSEIPVKNMSNLFGEFGTVLKNTVRWQAASSVIHGMMGSIQHAFSYAQQLNESLNKIQIVTNASDEHMARFAESANKAAQRLNTTTTAYTDASLIYYQQGLNDKQVAERTEVTIKMANAAGVSAQKVSDQMTAVWNNFDNGAHSLEYYADVMTALGAATASSTDEISTGLSKFASVADTVGLSYENAAAALATITATTRNSADSVGTGLRTLFSRLQSVSLGKTLDDGVTLTKYTKALETVGVSALDAAGNLRSMDDILEDMGGKWDTLNDAQKTALAQTVGGVRQYTTLIALMDNFDFYKRNQQVALNSEGTVQQQADIQAKSWEASQKRVKAAAESIYSDLINDDFFIGINNGISGFLSTLDNVIDGLGGLKGVLLAVSGIATKLFSNQMAAGMYKFGMGVRDFFTPTSELQKKRSDFIQSAADRMTGIANSKNVVDQTLKDQAGYLSKYLGYQNRYAQSYNNMTPLQRLIAQQGLDNYSKLQDQYGTAAATYKNARSERLQAQSATVTNARRQLENIQSIYNRQGPLSQEENDLMKKATQNGWLDQTTGKVDANKYYSDLGNSIKNDLIGPMKDLKQCDQVMAQFFDTSEQGIKDFKAAMEKAGFKDQNNILSQLTEGMDEDSIKNIFAQVRSELEGIEDLNIESFKEKFGIDDETMENLMAKLNIDIDSEDALQQLKDELENQGLNLDEAIKGDHLMQTLEGVTQLASGVTMLGAAISSLTTMQDVWHQMQDGVISTSDGLSQLATGFLTMVPMLVAGIMSISAACATLQIAAWPIFAIMGAIAAVTVGMKAWDYYHEDDTEKLARLQEEAANAKSRAQEAKVAYDELLSSRDQHNDLLNTLNELTEGTTEFRDTLLEANEVAQEMIKLNDLQYGKDWFYDERGAIQFKEGVLDQAAEAAAERRQVTNEMATMAEVYAAAQDVKTTYGDRLDQMGTILNGPTSGNGFIDWVDSLSDSELERIASEKMKVVDQALQRGEYVNDFSDQGIFAMLRDRFNDYNEWRNQGGQGQLEDYFKENGQPGPFTASEVNDLMNIYFGQTFDEMFANADRANEVAAAQLSNSLSSLFGEFTTRFNDSNELIDQQLINDFLGEYAGNPEALEQLIPEDINTRLKTLGTNVKNLSSMQEFYKDITGTDFTLTDDNAADMKAMAEGIKQWTMRQQLWNRFSAAQQTYVKALGKDFDNYEELTGSQLEKLQASQELNAKQQEIWNNFKNQAQIEYANDAANMMAQYSRLNDYEKELSAEDIAKNFSLSDLRKTSAITSKFESAYGKDLAKTINQSLVDEIGAGDRTLQKALSKIAITGDAIVDIKSVKKATKELGEEAAETIEEGIREAKGGKKGLFEDLYKSEDFSKDLKKLQKQFKKTGKIGADAILDIADESEYLTDWLDEAEISAAALADMLEMIELNPDVGLDMLTNELMEAMELASGLENNLSKVFQHIDNFQQERSTQDIGKFYKNLTGSVQSAWKSGQIMDPQALQAWGELFGSESLGDYRKFMADITNDDNLTPQQIEAAIKGHFENEIAAMQSIQKYGDLSGMFEYYDKKGTVANGESMFSFNSETGQVTAVDKNILAEKGWDTTEGFVKGLMDNYGISEDMARAMTAEYAATNADLNRTFRTSEAELGLGRLFGLGKGARISASDIKENGAAIGTATGDKMVTAAEIKGYYDQYSDILDEMYDLQGTHDEKQQAFLDKMKQAANQTGNAFINLGKDWLDQHTKLSDLARDFKDQTDVSLDEYMKNAGREEDGTWKNLDKAIGAYERLGYTAQQAYDLVNQEFEAWKNNTEVSSAAIEAHVGNWKTSLTDEQAAFATFVGANETQWNRFNEWLASEGITGQITPENWSEFLNTDGAAAAIQSQADIFANSFKEAFADLFTSLEFDGTHFKIKPEIDTEDIDTPEVPIEGDTENIEQQLDNISEEEIKVPVTPEEQAINDAIANLEQKQNEIEQANNQMAETLQQQLNDYLQEASKSLEEYKQLQTEAIEQAKQGLTEEAQATLEQAEAAMQQAQEAVAKAEAIQSHLEGLQTEITNQATSLQQAINQGKLDIGQAASEAVNKYSDAASTAIAEAGDKVSLALQAAADGNIEAMNSYLSQAEAAASRAEAAASAVLGAAIVGASNGAITGPSEGMTPEQQQQHYQMANVLGQYAAGGYTNLNSWDYNRWNQSQGGTMPSWAEIADWATTYAPGTMNAWDANASSQALADIAAATQSVNSAIEASTQVQTEIATNTATSAEVAEGQAKSDSGANTQRRAGNFSVTEVGDEYHAKSDTSDGSSDGRYDTKGPQYESRYTGGDTGKESIGDTTALADSIKALGTDIKAGQEAAATTSTAKADAKINAKATLDKVEVNTTAEVPVEAKDPEQVVQDVQAEADGSPIETTATVTEVESDVEMEDQEATVDYDKGSQEEPEDEEAKVNYVRGTQQPPVDMSAAVNYVKGSQEPPSDMTATVNYVKGSQEGPGGDAGGYNNGNGSFFASGYGGNHIAGAYQGLATVGELGPELMIHGNQAFLVGINGRTTAYVHPDDTIYTAAETQKIMSQNPTLQDLPGFAGGYRWPGFSVGYSRISWGSTSPGSGSSKAPRAAAKQRSKDFDPERYHYQTRVIADLNRYLERMNKLKDHAYGSHRIRAIRNEITATEDLIKANEKLLDEANKYLEGDRKAAADLGAQFDNEGNIINWDELQEKYARPAAEDSENEEAKKNWKLIQQYEETIDKIHDTVAEIDDLRWSLSDLVNEEIEAKVDVKIDMDDRELDLLDYYLDKVKDNIDKTKDAIGIVNGELGVYTDEISTYQKVMDDLLRNARNAQGDKITGLTLDKWMKMTPEQRDALDIDYDLGKKLEEYSEEILDAMKKIQDLKLYAVDALNQAFEELNNNVQESTELFDHYGNLLESLKDISDLQGTIMNKDLQKAMDSLNKSMLNNTKNSIKAQQDYYKELSENAKVLKDQIANAQDWQVKEALQEQLDNIETLMRDAEQNILGLWQDGLSKAQDMFEFAIENITKEYEKAIAGAYANVDSLKEAYERQQTVNGQYVDDYERMYQLSKLQRTINRDLDAAAVNGNRHNKNLKALLTEIEGLQASGQEMSEYDLELLQKRYEYEKALADLEDARNAKQTVRLQRDRNGNWGYVYTAADDEELAKQEQAVEDKLYEWQKFEMESIDDFSSQLFDLQTEYGEKLSNIMSATWDSDEDRDTAIANLDAWYQERLEYLNKYLNTAFDDANSTIDKAKKRYDTDQFEIIDTFGETTLGMINNTVQTTEELIANLQDAMNNMKTAAQDALTTYSDTIIEFNKLVEESNELFAEYANGQATSITRLSDDQLGIVQKNIEDMANKLRTGNDAMLVQVEDFNKKYYEKFNDPETGIITTNERFLNQLQDILNYLNRIDYAVDSNATIQQEIGTMNSFSSVRDNAQGAARFDTGGYTGSWGTYGKFAVLDQKEQVFNAEDTKNLLDAAHILRTLDVQSGLFSKGLGDFFAPYVKDLGQTIEQDVHITAEFPNATNRTEIEEAFNNLVNRATQYANRKAG